MPEYVDVTMRKTSDVLDPPEAARAGIQQYLEACFEVIAAC